MRKACHIIAAVFVLASSAGIATAGPRRFVRHMACNALEYQEPDQTVRWRVQTKLIYVDDTSQEKLYAVTDSRKKAIGYCEKWFNEETKAEQARRKEALKAQSQAETKAE